MLKSELNSSAVVVKAINSIKTRSTNVVRDINTCIIDCMWHAFHHGDVTLMTRLVNALSTGTRVNAVITFAQAFTPLKWNKKKEAFKLGNGEWNIESAMLTTFQEFMPEKQATTLDVLVALQKILKRANKASEAGTEIKNESLVKEIKNVIELVA